MSNFNSCPIVITSSMAAGWRSLQTLNTGNSPATIQQPNPSPRQWGINVTELQWSNPGASASFLVVDPIDGTVLASGETPVGFSGIDPDITPIRRNWRDFKVSITGGTLYIWYRA